MLRLRSITPAAFDNQGCLQWDALRYTGFTKAEPVTEGGNMAMTVRICVLYADRYILIKAWLAPLSLHREPRSFVRLYAAERLLATLGEDAPARGGKVVESMYDSQMRTGLRGGLPVMFGMASLQRRVAENGGFPYSNGGRTPQSTTASSNIIQTDSQNVQWEASATTHGRRVHTSFFACDLSHEQAVRVATSLRTERARACTKAS